MLGSHQVSKIICLDQRLASSLIVFKESGRNLWMRRA